MTNAPGTKDRCLNCHKPIEFNTFQGMGKWEPDLDGDDPLIWRHSSGYAACGGGFGRKFAAPGWPEVVTLCGSTRFYDEFQRLNFELTMQGIIVISVGFYPNANPDAWAIREHGETVGITPADKLALDELHKRKIDLSDRIHVINVNDYIGESTRSEIRYAQENDKEITFMIPHVCARTHGTSECIVCGRL